MSGVSFLSSDCQNWVAQFPASFFLGKAALGCAPQYLLEGTTKIGLYNRVTHFCHFQSTSISPQLPNQSLPGSICISPFPAAVTGWELTK